MSDQKSRAVCFDITPEALAALLQLPQHACIDGVQQSVDRPGVLRVRVRGIGWPVANGALIPTVVPVCHRERDSQGRESLHVDWRCPTEAENSSNG